MHNNSKNVSEVPRSSKIMSEEHIADKKREGKSAPKLSLREEMEDVGVWPNGHAFWVLTCPKSQKCFSPKIGFPQIRIYFPILFPFPCNNYFNQFLAE